ncbi:hypothetical protein FA95DRAFT_1587475 [Auriscalpium vulgare]|uniref:Uncharacterized protein n=1 Tax=Auriscalpium vulgare TaxID=40419 RepID=A0ACB8S4Q6_9AGAM|nr:hypothetical protein FA95DRAFT_1587475 [Auriscalpium vulgare]
MAEQPPQHRNPISPISQLLQSIGLTRDDLTRHSDQMRQFLTTDAAASLRAFPQDQLDTERDTTPTPAPTRLASQPRSLSTTDASTSGRQSPPPITPVKTEHAEPSSSVRRFESMEQIIERQNRRSKRDRRVKREREASPALPRSPSLSASRSHSARRTRDSRRVSNADDVLPTPDDAPQDNPPPPVTPRAGRYYRDTVLYQSVTTKITPRSDVFIPRPESPSPSSSRRNSTASSLRSVSVESTAAKSASPFPPVTPRRNYYKTHVMSSSPAMSTPSSSPSRPIVNIVSSPGPMGPEPTEDDYDELPFILPPGPYSLLKPDLPYAALIGQAILASREHRLTLQEIYDFITIVYPHFKRNEQTWMNSIRHVLSTTVVFRKVQRDRAAGRTLWAIFDQDLECFASGGFRKEFCADMADQKARYTSRKRPAEDAAARKAKRAKKNSLQAEMAQEQGPPLQMGIPLSSVPPLSFSAPLFPHPHAGTHQQPYYAPYILAHPHGHPHGHPHPHTLPVGVIFPALPPGYQHMPIPSPSMSAATAPVPMPHAPSFALETSTSTAPPTLTPTLTPALPFTAEDNPPLSADVNPFVVDDELPSPTLHAIPPPSSSSSSLPELTPSGNSSSPPEPPEEPSELDKIREARAAVDISAYIVDLEDAPLDALAPGITLLDAPQETPEKVTKAKAKSRKAKEDVAHERPPVKRSSRQRNALPYPPDSPTLQRKAAQPKSNPPRPCTPPRNRQALPKPSVTPPHRPSTPPRKSSAGHQLSAMRTPLSHRGVHMSPSPSLAYYKSHLNPPPPAPSFPAGDADPQKEAAPAPATASADDVENLLRTPSRRRTSAHAPFTPATPRKLAFPGAQDSPFRTPGIFDPHDPSALLDDELARLGAQGSALQESPAGLFGRGGRGLLYESPDASSPGRWNRMW